MLQKLYSIFIENNPEEKIFHQNRKAELRDKANQLENIGHCK